MIDTPKKQEYIITGLALLFFALLAVATTLVFTRLDLTSGRAHTLSATARDLHREIPESVRITYFISKSLASRHPGAQQVEDFLRELEAASRGRIRVRIEDPAANPEQAQGFGVPPQEMQVIERNEQRVAQVYTGVVIEYLDDFQTLPVVIGTETIEYEVIKAIRNLINKTTQVAGFLVGDAGRSLEANYTMLSQYIQQAGYEPRAVAPGAPIESDINVLFVLGNSQLDRYDAYFIDQFIMRGGRVLFAVHGVNVDSEQGILATPVEADGVIDLLAAYGIELRRQLVLDEANVTVPFQIGNYSGGYDIQYIRYPHWIAVQDRFVNHDHPITSRFVGLSLYWPSPLTARAGTGLEAQPLITTTPKGWLQTGNFATAPQEEASYYLEKTATTASYTLALAVSGQLRSPFANGDLPARDGAEPLESPAIASTDSRFVVVSSTDFLSDIIQFARSEVNISFGISSADWLASAEDLIAIRTRAERDLRLNLIRDEDTRAALIVLVYMVNLVLIPALVIVWALLRAHARKRREQLARAQRGGEL